MGTSKKSKYVRHRRKRMYKLQKGLCWICGKRMAISQDAAGSPMYATFDHLTPKVEGGDNSQSNLKLAHFKCNNERQTIPVANILALQVVAPL